MSKKNENRQFVSASGTANDLVQKLAQAVYKRGGDDNDLRRIISDASLCDRLVDLLVVKPGGSLVKVDRSLGVEGHLKALKLDWAFEEGLLGWNPPIKKGSGSYEVAVEFLPLGEDMTTAEVEAMVAAKEDYRLALPEETMAHCAKYPDLQREAPIVCLGAFWVDPFGYRSALVLRGFAGGRKAHLFWDRPGDPWRRRDRVAVVRK